jgi:quercetin dioxygenase-like cupin family protein
MQRKMMWAIVASAVTVIAGAYVTTARATQASGFSSTTIAKGTFDEIDVFNQLVPDGANPSKRGTDVWLSLQKTKGASDLYVQNNLWLPGGTSGWHTHPGHSLIIVTAGAVTAYEADDPSCTPHLYTAGMTLVDPGGDHVHLIRNDGAIDARSITVQLIPAGAARRIDAGAPAACSGVS